MQTTGYTVASYKNYIWARTQDGLDRFDGYEMKAYKARKASSINNSFVQTLLTDSKNNNSGTE